MKKDILLFLVLIACIAGGIFFKYGFHYPFFSGLCSGSSLTLLIFASIGKWQAKKAAARIDKAITDQVRHRETLNN